jgi:hypothetical protein
MSEIEREKHVASIKERQRWLASTFRDEMTSGQSFKISNKYRKDFYNDVILSADKVNFRLFPPFLRKSYFF